MDSKVFAGLIVLIVLAGFYLVFFSEQKKETISFSDGVNEINALWQKNNVNPDYLINDSQEIKFSSGDLEGLYDDLTVYQSSLDEMQETKDIEALKDLIEIHLLLADELNLALKIKEKKDLLESKNINGSSLCENKTDLEFIGKNTLLLNQKMHSVNELIYAFNELHSGFEEKANLVSFLADETSFSSTELENQTVLNELERIC